MARTDIQTRRQIGFGLWLALIVIGLSWGSTQALSKTVMNAGHHPLGASFASTALGALIITCVLLVLKIRLPTERRHLIFYAICGLTGTAVPNFTSYTAVRELPVGIVSIIIAAVPIWTFLAAIVMRMERPDPRRIAGLACGALAVGLLIVPDASLPRAEDTFWVMVALITGLSYTIENIYIAKAQPKECGALQTLCGLSWAALLMIAPLTAASSTWMMPSGSMSDELALVAMTMAHLLAYGGFVWLIGQAGPVFAAQVGYVVTVSGVILGMAFFGESHTAWVWLSLLLMLGGLALVQPKRRDAMS